MSKFKVLYTDTCFPDISIEEKALGKECNLILSPDTSPQTLIGLGKDCDGVIVDYANINDEVIDSLSKCKVISRLGIGVNNIDIKKAGEKGISVINVPDYCLDEVADHTISLAMTLLRQIVVFNNDIKRGNWDIGVENPIHRLSTQNYCVYGLGNIARKVVERAKSFGFNICAFDPYQKQEVFDRLSVDRVHSLEDLAKLADVLSIHAPLNSETEGIISRKILNKMKPSSILINTSRGGLINESDLEDAIESNMISGAGLDVLTSEPPDKDSSLIKSENVILTPHIAFYSEESEAELRRRTAEEVLKFLHGHKPYSLVNGEFL